MSRVAEELGRLYAEKAALRDQVRSLQAQVDGRRRSRRPPSEQAVRILSSAQQTADNYVAEAEEFSRQVTGEARVEYEELIARGPGERRRDHPGRAGGGGEAGRRALGVPDGSERTVEELEEQVAYLKAFGQACRVQLRAYLEALLSDVETEWGHADPALLPLPAARPPGAARARGGDLRRELRRRQSAGRRRGCRARHLGLPARRLTGAARSSPSPRGAGTTGVLGPHRALPGSAAGDRRRAGAGHGIDVRAGHDDGDRPGPSALGRRPAAPHRAPLPGQARGRRRRAPAAPSPSSTPR